MLCCSLHLSKWRQAGGGGGGAGGGGSCWTKSKRSITVQAPMLLMGAEEERVASVHTETDDSISTCRQKKRVKTTTKSDVHQTVQTPETPFKSHAGTEPQNGARSKTCRMSVEVRPQQHMGLQSEN